MANIGGFLGALGQAFTGYGQDQQIHAERQRQAQQLAMQQAAQAQAAQLQQAQLANLTSEQAARDAGQHRQAANDQLITENWDAAVGGDRQAQAKIVSVRPELATAFMPKPSTPHRQYDAARGVMVDEDAGTASPVQGLPAIPKEAHDHFVAAGVDKDGNPVILNTTTGQTQAGGGLRGGSGTPGGAMATREKDFVGLMNQSLPTMQALALKVRPWAISGALKNPTIGNAILNQDEQNYMASARNFLAGALHQESGTRLTDSQIQFGQSRYLPVMGDTPETIRSKLKNAQSTFEERTSNVGRPLQAAPGEGMGTVGTGAPAGAGKPPLADRVQQLKAQGLSKEAARAQLAREGYDVGGGD